MNIETRAVVAAFGVTGTAILFWIAVDLDKIARALIVLAGIQ